MNLLNTTRLKSVKRVRLLSRYHPDEEEAEAVFGAILEHEGIRELNISQNQINKVNSDTLARAVNFMEQVSSQSKDGNRDSFPKISYPSLGQFKLGKTYLFLNNVPLALYPEYI